MLTRSESPCCHHSAFRHVWYDTEGPRSRRHVRETSGDNPDARERPRKHSLRLATTSQYIQRRSWSHNGPASTSQGSPSRATTTDQHLLSRRQPWLPRPTIHTRGTPLLQPSRTV